MTNNFKGFKGSFSDLVAGGREGRDKEEGNVGEKGSVNVGLGFFLNNITGGGEESDLVGGRGGGRKIEKLI